MADSKIDPDVAQVLEDYPARIRSKLLSLRRLILKTAAGTEGVGLLTETLKWGEPAYLPAKPRIGSTIRIGWKPSDPDTYAMYFICNTNLVDTFRTRFPELTYEGNRAILLSVHEKLPKTALSGCVEMALTYHLHKNQRRRA